MAFENSQAFTTEGKNEICSDQFECTCRLEIPNEKQVKKVLGINAIAKITGQEKVSDGVNFAGDTYFHVAYETEEGVLASATAVASWQQKIEAFQNENYAILPEVKETVLTGQSLSEICVSALIDVKVVGITAEKIYSVEGIGADYVKLENTHEYQKAVNFVTETFNEVSEQQIAGKVEDVLQYFGNVRVKNVTAGIDTVTIDGEAYVNVALLIDGEVVNQVKTFDFKHEAAVLSTVPNNLVDATVNLANLNVTASVSEIDNNTNLIFALDLSTVVAVYSKDNMVVVEDLFSTEKETACQYECVKLSTFEGEKYFTDNQVISFIVDKEVENICYLSNAVANVNDVIKTEGGVTLNGAVCVDAVFTDENQGKFTFQGFAPFSVQLPDADAEDDFNVTAKVLSYKLKSQNEVVFTTEIDVTAKNYQNQYVTYVSSVQENEEKAGDTAAIRVYVTGENEKLFGIAKAINVRPEDILSQNPIAENNIEKGTRLVVYTPLNIKF